MGSLGSWSSRDRATVSPPTPESNTPIGASLVTVDTVRRPSRASARLAARSSRRTRPAAPPSRRTRPAAPRPAAQDRLGARQARSPPPASYPTDLGSAPAGSRQDRLGARQDCSPPPASYPTD